MFRCRRAYCWLARQSQSHDAYVFERVTVHYRWLALHGISLQCQRRVSLPDGEYLHCELPDGAMGAIPVWMTDPVTCAGFSLGEPLASVEALTDLRALLDSLRSIRSAGTGIKDEESTSPGETAVANSNEESDGKCFTT